MARPTILDLRDDVSTLLEAEIGTYTVGTKVTPALWVSPPQPPSNRVVTGLEVIIQKTPSSEMQRHIGSRAIAKEVWTITLIQRDPTKSTRNASNILLYNYAQSRQTFIPANDITFEQSKVYINSYHFIRNNGYI